MFKNTFQSGFLSILYSIGSKPLQIWDKKVRNGHIKRITDNDIQSLVLEVEGTNVSTTYITCPADPKKTLGIKLPFLVMIIKNLKKYFTFEVQVLDDKNVRRRFRASNYQSTTRVKPFICTMPMRLDDGWNQIQFNLSDFTRRAYGTNYIETLRVQIHANCRIRRVYFSDRLYSEDELPAEFKLYLPVQNKAKVSSITPAHVQNHMFLSLCINLVYFLHSSDTADGIPSFPLFILSAHVHIGWILVALSFCCFSSVVLDLCDWFQSAE
uniref:Cilia and flagella associated protein 20 n=1 Tax=Cyprinus carpio carpio TaxID=630221 RepID=A0A9J7XY33_CYPCA